MSYEELSPSEKITKARIQLNQRFPFFGYLTMNMKMVKNNKMPMPTMGVSPFGELHYTESFVNKLEESQLQGVLCHEAMHLALEHLTRVGNRDRLIWNYSADLVINTILNQNNISLPKDVLMPDSGDEFKIQQQGILIKDISKKTTEQIYDELYRQVPRIKIKVFEGIYKGKSFDNHFYDGDGKGKGGKKKGEKGGGQGLEGKIPRKDWKRILSEAHQHAKIQGNAPLGVERFIDELLNPKMNWKSLLQKYVIQELPSDYTYSRPSKRSVSTGFYMPDIVRDTIDVAIAIDTSGSISEYELKTFLSEIVSIARSHNNIKMKLVTHDYVIHDRIEVSNGSIRKIMDLVPKGGGGTSHRDVFKWAEKERVKILICFTDGYSDQDEIKTRINTVWVMTTEMKAKFGKVIKFECPEEHI